MNAPPRSNFNDPNYLLGDERMEQVREILIGDAIRDIDARVAFLEGRLAEVEGNVARQLDVVEAKVTALAGTAEGDRRTAFEALARSVADLGEQIRRIGRS